MALKLHNTLSRKKEIFQPINPDHVTMYVCGPTVYDRAHIGNARPYVVFDVLYRYLKETYPKVTYARNFTDVDDKIIKAAAERSIEISELTSQTEDFFHSDMGAIGVGIPDIEPRATEHIDEMIAMIEKLIAKGHAYEAEGHALFDVSSMKDYGKLSGKNQDELIAGARVEVAPYKRTPCDFVLWKPAKEDEPGWDSPWGRGRPGWHIECSAMAEKHLGKQIDIHGGGQDLVFPHHENEVAQSTCAHDGLALSRYWVHNGMLMVEGKKMSKSLGNFFTVSDVLALAPGDVIRYYILSTHYHQPFDWTKTSLEQARQSLNRLYTALANAPVEYSEPLTFNQLPQAFIDAIEDDLNTPLAFAVMHEWAGRLNKAEESEEILSHTYGQLLLMGRMLGIFTVAPATWLKGLDTVTDAEVMEIESLIKERIEARKTKDFARADEIRDILVNKDIILEDRSGETIWRKK